MKTHIFRIITPKFYLQIHYDLEGTAANVQIYWYNNFDFLMNLHNSLITSVTYIFSLRRETKKEALGETSQHMLRGQGQSVESGKYTSKWA